VKGGYLNFYVNRPVYARYVYENRTKQHEPQSCGKILIEYSSPNIAKPFHVGHLMTTLIGDALYRLYAYMGYEVVRINHLGDYGTQFGKLIYAYEHWGNAEALEQNPIAELLRIYVLFHEKAAVQPELDEYARRHFLALEKGEDKEVQLWEQFRSLSLTEFGKIYGRLGIEFDSYAGESFYSGQMAAVIERLEEAELLEDSNGAKVVRLDEWNMPPCMIVKSDGGSIYATRDLAAAIYRQEAYSFTKCLYVVGEPQALHFRQVFAVLKLLGFHWADACAHIGYAHMRFAGGKLSTRSGNLVILEDLLDEGVRRAKERLSDDRIAPELLDEVAEVIGVGAVKFAFLKNSRIHEAIFDWDEVLDMNGASGPYVQYAYTRCRSLLQKAGFTGNLPDREAVIEDIEFELIKTLQQFEEAVVAAIDKSEPSMIAKYAFTLAQSFNRFYNQCKVIGSGQEGQRLRLAAHVADTIAAALGLLGIRVTGKM
jgi:arginyl-tRNA synthetase